MSSSFNLEQVRKFYQDPHLAKISDMSKRIATLESDNIEIKTEDVVGRGDSARSWLLINDKFHDIKRYGQFQDNVFFDGSNDYLDLGAQPSLWSRSITNFSYSIWVNPNSLSGNPYRSPFGVAEAGDASISLYFTNVAPFSGYVIGADVTSDDYVANAAGRYSTNLCQNLGQWYNVVFTYSQSGTSAAVLKLFVDGVLQSNVNDWNDSMNEPIDISGSTKALIGRFITSQSADSFNGKTKDFRWWNETITDDDAIKVYRNDPTAPIPDYWIPMKYSTISPVDVIQGLGTTFVNGPYYPEIDYPLVPNEPDYNFLKCHLKFNSQGNTLYDYSGFGHNFEIFGEPCPTVGINQGLRGTSNHSLAHTFDGASDGVHYENYENSTDMKILGLTTGISYVFFVNAASLTDTGTNPCLYEKMDDTSNRVRISWQPDGQLKFLVKRAGTDYKVRLSTGALSLNTDYILVLTYAVSGNVSKIYVNGVDTATVASSEGWNGSTTTAFVGISGNDTNGWFNPNFIQDFRIYRERVLNQAHVNNLQKNKLSISDIAYGAVAISDACVCPFLETESFTDQSFTTTSYTAGV